MSKFNELDEVRILVPVSGVSEVREERVSFPAGTHGAVVYAGENGCIVEFGWGTSATSCDGLLVDVRDEQMERVQKAG